MEVYHWSRVCFSGVCREGERLVVGPTDDGHFLRLKVGSIQRNRSACRVLRAGQAATLALGNFDRSLLRKVRGHMAWKQRSKKGKTSSSPLSYYDYPSFVSFHTLPHSMCAKHTSKLSLL